MTAYRPGPGGSITCFYFEITGGFVLCILGSALKSPVDIYPKEMYVTFCQKMIRLQCFIVIFCAKPTQKCDPSLYFHPHYVWGWGLASS